MTTELFADCAMLWLGTSATATAILLGILQIRDRRRSLNRARGVRLVREGAQPHASP